MKVVSIVISWIVAQALVLGAAALLFALAGETLGLSPGAYWSGIIVGSILGLFYPVYRLIVACRQG